MKSFQGEIIIASQQEAQGKRLGAMLLRAGFEISRFGADEILQFVDKKAGGINRTVLVIWLGLNDEPVDTLRMLSSCCSIRKIPWLRATFSLITATADIGPFFAPGCYACFADVNVTPSSRLDNQTYQGEGALIELWLAAIVLSVLDYLDSPESHAAQVFRRHHLPEWHNYKIYAPCLHRADPSRQNKQPDRSFRPNILHEAVLFESSLAERAREPMSGETRVESRRTHATIIQRHRFANSVRLPFEKSTTRLDGDVNALLCQHIRHGGTAVTRDHLGLLLQLSAGFRKRNRESPELSRWASSAGNRGSVELFVLIRNVQGVEPGIYFYEAKPHALVRLERRCEKADLTTLFLELLPHDPDCELAILFTSAYARLERKYSYFGYKLSQLDAGVAMSQLSLVALAFGFRPALSPVWSDKQVEDVCRLIKGEQQVTGVMAISKPTEDISLPIYSIPTERAGQPSAPELFAGVSLEELYNLVYQKSHSESFRFVRNGTRVICKHARVSAVPQLRRPALALSVTLTRRESTRIFSLRSIDVQDLSAILYAGSVKDPFQEHDGMSPDLSILLVAKRVVGLDPGYYRFDPSVHTLSSVGTVASAAEERNFFRGEDYSSSAAFVLIAGDVMSACDREGSLGYRKLLIRAGALANRLLFSAIASHLKGAVIAGIQHSATYYPEGSGSFGLITILLGRSVDEG